MYGFRDDCVEAVKPEEIGGKVLDEAGANALANAPDEAGAVGGALKDGGVNTWANLGTKALVEEVGALEMMAGATLTTGFLGGLVTAGGERRSTLASGGLSTA